METVLEKLKDHQSLSNKVQANTQTDQLTGKEQQGVSQKALWEYDIRIMIWNIWRIEEGKRKEKKELIRLAEGMKVEQGRISGKEDHVQWSLSNKRAKHTSR